MRPARAASGLAALFLAAVPLLGQKVPVQESTLSNGMRLLLVVREGEPSVAGGWVAHVGSANERPGITGISHLFEHMMFKGTPTIGTTDAARDLKILAEQEKVRDEIRQEEAKMRAEYRHGDIDDILRPENRTPRLKELEKQFDQLVADERAVLVKNEFDRIYTNGGGSGMNAFTNHDMTGYFVNVPSNKLELWMWMESERLLHPVFREFYSERDVVFEERRLRTDSTPLGKFRESFDSMFWESHPYSWPVVGWPSDIPAITKAQADAYYATYYSPQNITLILVGELDPAAARAMAERYFGRIPAGKSPVPDVVTLEVKQQVEKRMYAEAETNPQIEMAWHTVAFGNKDAPALQVLAVLLSSRTGRLYKGLVLGSQVATDAVARQESRKWAGLFAIRAEAREGKRLEDLEAGVEAELEKLKTEDVPAEELQKVKNNFAAGEYRRLSANFPILRQLIDADGLGDWREINEAGVKVQAVTAADVRRVAAQYFTRENRTVAVYTRKTGAAPERGRPRRERS